MCPFPPPHASPAAPHLTSCLQEGVKCAHLQGRKVELREVRRRVRARFDLPGLDSQVHVISDWLKECSKPLSASSGDLSIFLVPMSRPELGPEYYGIDGKVKDGERPPLLTIRAGRASQGKPNREIQQSWKSGRPPSQPSSLLLSSIPPPLSQPTFLSLFSLCAVCTLKSQPSGRVGSLWGSGFKLRSTGLGIKCSYLVSHFAGPLSPLS